MEAKRMNWKLFTSIIVVVAVITALSFQFNNNAKEYDGFGKAAAENWGYMGNQEMNPDAPIDVAPNPISVFTK